MKAAVAWQPFINSKTVGNRIICRTSVIIQGRTLQNPSVFQIVLVKKDKCSCRRLVSF